MATTVQPHSESQPQTQDLSAFKCEPGKPYRRTQAPGNAGRNRPGGRSQTFENACVDHLFELMSKFKENSSDTLWLFYGGQHQSLPGLSRQEHSTSYDDQSIISEWETSVKKVVSVWPRLPISSRREPQQPVIIDWEILKGVMFVKVMDRAIRQVVNSGFYWFEPRHFLTGLELYKPDERYIYILSLDILRNLTLHHMSLATEVVRLTLITDSNLSSHNDSIPIDVLYSYLRAFAARQWLSSRDIREILLRQWSISGDDTFDSHIREENWDIVGFTMRCMVLVPDIREPSKTLDGFPCLRSAGRLPSLHSLESVLPLQEARFSLLMIRRLRGVTGRNVRQHIPASSCLIFAFNDMPTDHEGPIPRDAPKFSQWDLAHGCAYLDFLQEALRQWARHWQRVLDMIDDSMRTDLNDILLKEKRSELMFDTSFNRVDLYFTIIELLRHSLDWVEETKYNTKSLITQIKRWNRCNLKDNSDPDALDKSVSEVTDQLKIRIRIKRDEVISLRDGLVDGTALKEASKSTTMNRYVMVFTIMTVLYLPPSFATSVWGMDIITAPFETWRNTTIGLSLATYFVSFLLLAWVSRHVLPDKIKKIRQGISPSPIIPEEAKQERASNDTVSNKEPFLVRTFNQRPHMENPGSNV